MENPKALMDTSKYWKMLIGKILSGEVDETNLDKWLAFFDDPTNGNMAWCLLIMIDLLQLNILLNRL